MKKEEYMRPEFEIILLKPGDVITNSGGTEPHETPGGDPWADVWSKEL